MRAGSVKVGDTILFRYHPEIGKPDFPVTVSRILGPHRVSAKRWAVGFLGPAPAGDAFWEREGGVVHVGPFLVDEEVPTP